MKSQRNIARYLFGLTLALGLTSVAALMFELVALAHPLVTDPSWTFTGSLGSARYGHTATLLPNGKVLVVGGWGFGYLDVKGSAELYDPATGAWSGTGSLNTPRYRHTATLLPSGKVLVAGGWGGLSSLKSAELYDPATGRWEITGNLITARDHHTATLLPNGKVLVAGGYFNNGPVTSAELYEPATGIWSSTRTPSTIFGRHAATRLPNGKVLATGNSNCSSNTAELYEPATETWRVTASPDTLGCADTATLLPNGKVLVTISRFVDGTISVDLYNPTTESWGAGGNLNRFRGHAYTATLLPNGQVLLAGGNYPESFREADLYNPATATWVRTGSLNEPRGYHSATLLPNGRVLVAGGANGDFDLSYTTLSSAELFDLAPGTNLVDDAQFFVRQHYLDFLSREPDSAGLAYWTDRITQCGDDVRCVHERRIGVSAAFFVEQEFQQTGHVVYRLYRAAYGTMANAPSRANVTFAQFMADRGQLVGGPGLTQSTINFANDFVSRPKFKQAYPDAMSPVDFVNELFNTANLYSSPQQRQDEIDALLNGSKTRAQVLLDVIDIQEFKDREYNPAFVLMQYFGYLRRDPDQGGYDFWLNVVNNREPNNYRGMVCAFITSTEYQLRFGSVVTHTNAECGP